LLFFVAGFALFHLYLLHQAQPSSSLFNDDFIDTVAFYPYFFIKDFFVIMCVNFLLFYLLFFNPNLLGHPDNYVLANAVVTPLHIVPEWYFLPFYAILRSVPNKTVGVITMFSAIILFAFLPAVHQSAPAQIYSTQRFDFFDSAKYNCYNSLLFWLFTFVFIFLGACGSMPAVEPFITFSFVLTNIYFFYFVILFSNVIVLACKCR